MTTYRLTVYYGDDETFEAEDDAAAIETARDMLTGWYGRDILDETARLRGTLSTLVAGDWTHLDDVELTVDPAEPPCTAQVDEHEVPGHVWHSGEVWGHDGGVTWTDECARCGLRYTTDTWHTDPETGEPFRREKYKPAEMHEEEEGS